MIYGYARVSSPGQDPAAQAAELAAAGCERIFAESRSAAAHRKRPELRRVLAALQPGDVLVITRLNRVARSARDALNILETVRERGAAFRSLREAWADTTTPIGRLAVTILAGFAEFDREQILERTAEGRAHAQARGVKMGRRPTLSARQVAFIRQEREPPAKQSLAELAALLGVSRSTICRAAREPAAPKGNGLAKPTRPLQMDIEELAGPAGGVTTAERCPPT